MSIRATARTAEVSKNTVIKYMMDAGKACAEYQDRAFHNLPCTRIQCDEIWSFIYCKDRNVKRARKAPQQAGDVWTWTAICADTELVPCWRVGDRSGMTAIDLMDDLMPRLANRVQLTTDGLKAYLASVEGAFGGDVDYAQLIKLYGDSADGKRHDRKYSPTTCTGSKKVVIEGNPDEDEISTSYVERQNLTMRMSMRRFTRLTNAFSKKVENHAHRVALHFMHYNSVRIQQTLRVTPGMAANVTDTLWKLDELVRMIEEAAPKPNRPKTYRKREISN